MNDAPHNTAEDKLQRLVARAAAAGPALPCAVVHPVDAASLEGAMEAAEAGLILPILVGPAARIRSAAAQAGIDLAGALIEDVPHSHAAAERAVALVREGRAGALLKGALHTDELMAAVVSREGGLRTERRISHCFILDVPRYHKPLVVTDAAINIEPDLETKADIARNAIDLCRALGIARPKVAVLAAVEVVTPKQPATLDAAALSKMADRGQIEGGIVDGPLAFDNAISRDAAASKHLESPVAGDPDILLVPDLTAGNMLAKQLQYLAGAESAGLVVGARVPIALTSRAEGPRARLASCAVMKLAVGMRVTKHGAD
ncbi:bifunctional enoyl-CoA hydratase/phosphate acetyltransferase [Roseicella aerolata]|uniref:bifunctional enoyl-CoA hydratase/phosphate acetyltransferase n=1 Tax=Roseicella aerolata TaxID=2883479 RepID=UPI0021F557F3|nr:bifunctional enoyl-CoA hydratase/phosphate acetyltransferase [Roseicella aerolata]